MTHGKTPLLAIALFLACWIANAAELETARWQEEVDRASERGGGIVSVPAGRHLVGQIDLKSGVELHLEEGAVLEGAVGLEHYRVVPLPYSEGLVWSAIVMAVGQTNVSITGKGEIFGNGHAWPLPRVFVNHEGQRARGVVFADCRVVRLSDFRLRDTACWGCVFK